MSGTSVRKLDVAGVAANSVAATPAVAPASTARAAQIAQLRAKMAEMGGAAAEPVAPEAETLVLGEQLRFILPGGGLPRRAVTHMSDTPALIVDMLQHTTCTGGYAAVVGWPHLSYAAIPAHGLDHLIAVPDPGGNQLGVAAALVEGLDLVVYYSPLPRELTPARARPLLGKLRAGQAALVLVGATVPSPALTVTSTVAGFRGIGRGVGRITGLDLHVRAQPKSAHPSSGTVTVGAVEATGAAGAVAVHPPSRPALQVVP